jgi:hypothetical protein
MMNFSRQTTRAIGMAALLVLATCGLATAQPGEADPAFARMHAKLKAGDRVTVNLENGSVLKGHFIDAGPGALAISTPAGDRRLSPSDVSSVRKHGRGILLGTIIGGGIGLACGTALGSLFANEGHDRDPALFGLTALGLGAGAAIDAALNIPRTVYQRAPAHAKVTVDAGPRRATVAVVVAF